MRKRRYRRTAAAALLWALAPAAGWASSPAGIEQDAVEYARAAGISAEEGLRRLRAQEESVAFTDALRATYARRLAGITVEHDPEYRIVVLLTGRKKVAAQSLSVGGLDVPVVFRTGAQVTEARIVKAIERNQAAIRRALRRPPAMGADPRTGELVILVDRGDAEQEGVEQLHQRFERMTRVPVRIRVLDGETGNLGLEGGARVDGVEPTSGRRQYCTTGFAVTDGTRTGLVTAAHCPDALTYRDPRGGGDVPLEFLGQWGWSFQDVQLHVADASTEPTFYSDGAKTQARTVTGARPRASTRAGDVVCRRGETSGYGCSTVELTHFAPPGDLCGGPCAPTWVTVRGACRPGDSGGPVFLGTTAFGIVKGGGTRSRSGKCDFWFYMSTDYLPDGWSLLTGPAAAVSPPLSAGGR